MDPLVLSDVAEMGAEYATALRGAIGSADVMLIVLREHAPRDQFLDAGLAAGMDPPIITVALDDAPLPRALNREP